MSLLNNILSRPFGEGSPLVGLSDFYNSPLSIFYLLFIIIAFCLYIYLFRRRRQSLINPSFITPIIFEMVEEVKKSDDTNKYKALVQEKTKEIAEIDNLLQNLEQNLEKEKQVVVQKELESKRDLLVDHARLYSAVTNFSLGFIMTNIEKNITFVNKAAKDLSANWQTNLTLQDLQTLVTGKIDFLQSTEDALKNNSTFIFEDIRVNNKYTNIYISPIIIVRNNLPETTGVAILIEDKTEEILIKRSRENFFIIASHELRTPLTGIKGYIAIIKQLYFESIKDEQLKKIINDIDVSSSRLINIVNDFLETSKLDPDKIIVRLVPCDLITIINSSIKETSSIAVEKNLFIKFDTPAASATVRGDKDKIKQILINLLSNALKYTEHGGITLNLEKTQKEQYKISIKDTGKGMSTDNINLLFSKFQQTDPNKTSNIISTGLGLYISKLLAEKMQGTIKLENSEVGKGSTFSLSLPAYQQDIAIPAPSGVN